MNLDPLAEDYSQFSPYVHTLNNPIFFIDPDGRKIRNADEERRKKAEGDNKAAQNNLNNKASYLGISSSSSRKEWKEAAKAKGGKAEWNRVKNFRSEASTAKSDLKKYTKSAGETQGKIDAFAKSSPNMFAEMDGLNVDIMMSTDSMSDLNGKNQFQFDVNNTTGDVGVKTQEFGDNTLIISIDNTMEVGHDGTVPTTLEATKHEMGHASYTIEKTRDYHNYTEKLKKDGKKFKGGHRKDDLSGQRAEEWQGKKDIK